MDRRALLRAALVLGGGGMMPQLGNGGGLDVATEATRTAELKAAYGTGAPGALRALEEHGRRLLNAWHLAKHGSDSEDVGLAFADVAQHLAHIHYKSANYNQGMWWAEEAEFVAQRIRHLPMVTVAVCRKSIIRAAQGDWRQGILLAEMAKRRAGGPYAEALTEIHVAYAHGVNTSPEHVYNALSALDRAEAAVDRAGATGDVRPVQTVDLTTSWQDYHRGNILVRSDPKRADAYLVRILNGLPEHMRLTRGSIQVRRAQVAVATGNYEQAVALAKEGLAIATDGGVTRDVWRVMRLRNELGEVAPARLVSQLDHALEPHRQVRGSVLWRNDRRT